jgi:hypothetical protein
LLCFAINYLQPGDAAGGTTLAGLWLTLCAAAAWAASNIVSRLAQQTSLMQCFALAGTNKKKGFWVLARRKPQRYQVVGRGFGPQPGEKRRFFMRQIA